MPFPIPKPHSPDAHEPSVRAIVAQFEEAWRQGRRPDLEDFLPAQSEFQLGTLAALVVREIQLRSGCGQKPQLREYMSRFPELATDPSLAAQVQHAFGLPARGAPCARSDPRRGKQPDTSRMHEEESVAAGRPGSAGPGNDEMDPLLARLLGPGEVLGNYKILQTVGKGGMGLVVQAQHVRMERVVALKILAPRLMQTPVLLQRFAREVKVAARLVHPNIVTAYDADEAAGLHFFVMEYVSGIDLARFVKSFGPLSVRKAVGFVIEAARGLEYAHRQGIVHRDIKPGNLMLCSTGTIKVLDMGLARFEEGQARPEAVEITDTGNTMGTIDFMAPEQALDASQADARSDIYSLGCTLYYILAGRAMFERPTVMARLLAHRDEPPPSLRTVRNDVSLQLDGIVQRMVAKQPSARFRSMTAVIEALSRCDVDTYKRRTAEYALVTPVVEVIPVKDPAPRGAGGRAQTAATMLSKPQSSTARQRAGALPVGHLPAAPRWWRRPMAMACVGGALLVGLVVIAWKLARPPVPQAPEVAPAVAQPALPVPLRAPFSPRSAAVSRTAWAKHLKLPGEAINSLGMTMVFIPPAEFTMGTADADARGYEAADESEMARARIRAESPAHQVTLSNPFYLATHETTQAQFRQLMGFNPSKFQVAGASGPVDGPGASLPAESITWFEAVEFCNRLSQREGLPAAYAVDGTKVEYQPGLGDRLPTEAEWEFACRAGSTARFGCGQEGACLLDVAWFDESSADRTHPIAQKLPNAWGLFDTLGNVAEWCHDWYWQNAYSAESVTDPLGPADPAETKVIRGGSWFDGRIECRPAARADYSPDFRSDLIGFRIARTAAIVPR